MDLKMDNMLHELLERLKKCSEIKYPNFPWSEDFYETAEFCWKDKLEELEQRVLEFEEEIKHYGIIY